jgi:hypothetical protein
VWVHSSCGASSPCLRGDIDDDLTAAI